MLSIVSNVLKNAHMFEESETNNSLKVLQYLSVNQNYKISVYSLLHWKTKTVIADVDYTGQQRKKPVTYFVSTNSTV